MRLGIPVLLLVLVFPLATLADGVPPPQVVDIKSADGTHLKATYFSAGRSGPAVLLIHQVNRARGSWDAVAAPLAAAGINVLTLDLRGFGESGGTPYDTLSASSDERRRLRDQLFPEDIDAALRFLSSQPGVKKDNIGLGGAGGLGVESTVRTAMRHQANVKSLLLMSGETVRDGLQFLHQASDLPQMFVVADGDEYPPTVEAMELLYATSGSPAKRFVHYSAAQDAPWLWYEPLDVGRVPATGEHGTDLFKSHTELPGVIVDWFVTTLIKTPGHAPADAVAASTILNRLEWGGSAGIAEVTRELTEARNKNPGLQLFPEVDVDIIGEDYGRAGDFKTAIEVFKLNLLAYPDSIDARSNLADAYVQAGQKDLAQPLAEEALAMLDAGKLPLSSWSDTQQRRAEVRKGLEQTLAQAAGKQP